LIKSHSPKPSLPKNDELAREFDVGILNFDIKDQLFKPKDPKKTLEKELQGVFFN
jgi:hypothetical protein